MKAVKIVLALVATLFAIMLVGCTKQRAEPLPSDNASPAVSAKLDSENELPEPESSYGWPEPQYGDAKDFVINIEGQKETVTMTYAEIDYSLMAKVNVGLYIDLDRYRFRAFEAEYDILPVATGEYPVCSVHIFPWAGKSVEEAVAESKNIIANNEDATIEEGEVELDNYTAYYLESENACSYFIEYDGGCLGLYSSYENTEAKNHQPRLLAMIKTVMILN
ncbi:MAG: hypothetical protein CVU91_10280 [Firmicutes bacterium HGW-Firmicutes-16]|nr:MAG: hypothetical protein CVU91_10280 [Firmicutes bacterium HGW-Firmicutes-16]